MPDADFKTPHAPHLAIVIDSLSDDAPSRAQQLAQSLGLPVITSEDAASFTALLVVTDERLELRDAKSSQGPVYCDFLGGSFGHRITTGHLRSELLAKAVGYKGQPISVIDTTAGLGRDAALLALLGCRVTGIERNPVLTALLQDGLDRANAAPDTGHTFAENLRLIHADARQHLASLAVAPDVVYLDPMFPHRKKTALVKKEMRLTRLLTGDDPDAHDLFDAALATGALRVVVKRAPLAERMVGPTPSHAVKGKAVRYDIYIQHPPRA